MGRWLWIIGALAMAGPLGATSYPCGAGARGQTYDEYAAVEYASGAGHLDRAHTFEAKYSGVTDPEEQARGRKKIQRAYYNAKRHFDRALECDSRLTEAYTARGFALRELGELEASLESYNAALALAPNDAAGLLGRAETCLALKRFDDVRDTYVRLSSENPESASDLLIAMQAWARDHASGTGSDAENSFGDWVRGGARLAGND